LVDRETARVPIGELGDASVLTRFVKSTSAEIIDDIIRFNNSQNPIRPSDFRSRDPQQGRLRQEFSQLPDVTYLGARRGGQSDAAEGLQYMDIAARLDCSPDSVARRRKIYRNETRLPKIEAT
jgi:hypothetical protein